MFEKKKAPWSSARATPIGWQGFFTESLPKNPLVDSMKDGGRKKSDLRCPSIATNKYLKWNRQTKVIFHRPKSLQNSLKAYKASDLILRSTSNQGNPIQNVRRNDKTSTPKSALAAGKGRKEKGDYSVFLVNGRDCASKRFMSGVSRAVTLLFVGAWMDEALRAAAGM